MEGRLAFSKAVCGCRAELTSDSDAIEVWLVTNMTPCQSRRRHSRPAAERERRPCATLIRSWYQCRALLTSESDPIEVWLVSNNGPVPELEADTAGRLQIENKDTVQRSLDHSVNAGLC